MSAGNRVPGLAAAGKGYTTLSREVRGVTEVLCGGLVLTAAPIYSMDSHTHGQPVCYAAHGDRLHLWPIPNKEYNLLISWDGHIQPEVVLTLPEGWYVEYEKALAAAQAPRP